MRNVAMLAVLCVVFASGCATAPYAGDGRFTDYGWFLFGGRTYGLDFGQVDLTKWSSQSYRLFGLPGKEWTLGLQITEIVPNTTFDSAPSHPARVRMTMRSADGEVFLLHDARVDNLIWNTGVGDRLSFYYARFSPRPNANYVLFVEVAEPDPQSCCSATLIAYAYER